MVVVDDVVEDVVLVVVLEVVEDVDVELVGGLVVAGGIVTTTDPLVCAPAGTIENTCIAGTINATFPAFFRNSLRSDP